MRPLLITLACLTLWFLPVLPASAAPGGDKDGDGIPDHSDQCPNHPEDRDGWQDGDGCPDPDNDGDGILDVRDKCPNQPENINGYQDKDGCPDRRPKVVIATNCPRIRVGVFFRRRSSKVQKRSIAIMNDVVKVLRSHPKVKLLEIQGHADDYRSAKADLRLSLRRAKVVRRYLIKKGVSSKRLVAKGYGRTRRRKKTRRAKDRAYNRRVMFEILKPKKRARPKKRP